jgi:hypothetical protein
MASGLPAVEGASDQSQRWRANTSTVGQKTFSVTAIDNAGNTTTRTNTTTSCTLHPDAEDPGDPGSAVPLIWQLKDANGVALSDLTSLVKL